MSPSALQPPGPICRQIPTQARWNQPCGGAWWHLLSFLLLPVAGLPARLEQEEALKPMPSMCCREQHRPWQASTQQFWGEMALECCLEKDPAQPGWQHLHAQPGIVGTGLDAAGNGPHQNPFPSRGRSSTGMGISNIQPCVVPAGAAASWGTRRAQCGQQSSCLVKMAKKEDTKTGAWPQALPSACPQGALPTLHLGFAAGYGMDGILSAPSMVTPTPLPLALLPACALPFRPSPLVFHPIPLSSTDAISPLLAPPFPSRCFMNFLAPGIKRSHGGRRCTKCCGGHRE